MTAAGSLLVEYPLVDVTLNAIAKRAGVSAPLIKYYFANRDGLMTALLLRDAAALVASLREVAVDGVDAATKLRGTLRAVIGGFNARPYLPRLARQVATGPDPAARAELIRVLVDPLIGMYRELLQRGEAQGAFRVIEPSHLHLLVYGACEQFFMDDPLSAHAFAASPGDRSHAATRVEWLTDHFMTAVERHSDTA